MARIIKEDEYNTKRNQILDMAQHLIYTMGYEQMTIYDLLDALHISKGALYHYFSSKEALFKALLERLGQEAERTLEPIVQDADLTAIQKFRRIIEGSAQWKSTQKEMAINLLHMWFSDSNAVIRQRMEAESRRTMAHFFEQVISQGVEEGTFTVRYPRHVAVIIAGVSLSLTDTMANLVLLPHIDQEGIQELEDTWDAYSDTVERILGAPAGSLHVFEPGAFDDWLSAD